MHLLHSRVLDISDIQVRWHDIWTETCDGEKAVYLTLNHCWGSDTSTSKAMSTPSIFLNEKNVITPRNLNQTFRDVMKISREWGHQYLWVDSLFTVQDNISELESESGFMASTYENLDLTIWTIHGKNRTAIIFSDRSVARDGWESQPWNTREMFVLVETDQKNSDPASRLFHARLLLEHHLRNISTIRCVPYTGYSQLNQETEHLFTRAWFYKSVCSRSAHLSTGITK